MPQWLLPILVGIAIALVGVIWKLLNDKIDALWNQVGRSSKEGMRLDLHSVRNEMSRQLGIESRVERLEKWRNGKP